MQGKTFKVKFYISEACFLPFLPYFLCCLGYKLFRAAGENQLSVCLNDSLGNTNESSMSLVCSRRKMILEQNVLVHISIVSSIMGLCS